MWYVTGLRLEAPRDIPGIGAKTFRDNLCFKVPLHADRSIEHPVDN